MSSQFPRQRQHSKPAPADGAPAEIPATVSTSGWCHVGSGMAEQDRPRAAIDMPTANPYHRGGGLGVLGGPHMPSGLTLPPLRTNGHEMSGPLGGQSTPLRAEDHPPPREALRKRPIEGVSGEPAGDELPIPQQSSRDKRVRLAKGMTAEPTLSAGSISGSHESSFMITKTSSEPTTLPANALQIVMQVPPGQTGPFTINLHEGILRQLPETYPAGEDVPAQGLAAASDSKLKFMGFPPEIRNNIYRYLFRDAAPVQFYKPESTNRSAQMLRTCRRVRVEAASILYGENAFYFFRVHKQRETYFSPPSEVGYKDLESFLNSIGADNLARIPEVLIKMEDASPSLTQHLTSNQRRFVNDETLIGCLQLLGRRARLRRLRMKFRGRRNLTTKDQHLMDALACIADLEECLIAPGSKINAKAHREIPDLLQRETRRSHPASRPVPGRALALPSTWDFGERSRSARV